MTDPTDINLKSDLSLLVHVTRTNVPIIGKAQRVYRLVD